MTLDLCYLVNECSNVLLVNPSSGEFHHFHFGKIDDISSRLDCSYQPEMFWCFSPTHASVEGKANVKGGEGSSGSCAGSGPVQLHCNFHVGCKCFTRTNYGRTWHSANEQAACVVIAFLKFSEQLTNQLMSFFFPPSHLFCPSSSLLRRYPEQRPPDASWPPRPERQPHGSQHRRHDSFHAGPQLHHRPHLPRLCLSAFCCHGMPCVYISGLRFSTWKSL